MLQIVLEKPGRFAARQVAEPTMPEGHALIRIERIGVCGTDLHAFAGRQPFFTYPRVLGHELGAEILEAPPNAFGLRAGMRCAVEPYLYCGECQARAQGKTNCCERLRVLGVHMDGGMQPRFAVPLHLLHPSEELTLDQLALVETLGIGAHAVRRSGIQGDETVLVVGAGPIGLAVIQFAQAQRARVRVLELNPQRREFVRQLGVDVLAEPNDDTASVVFDATGNKQSMEASFRYVSAGGKLVFVGLVLDQIAFDDPTFHRREITLLASRNSARLFPEIIHLIESGQIDTRPWITHRLALAEVPDRFPDLPRQPDLVKAMIEVSDG